MQNRHAIERDPQIPDFDQIGHHLSSRFNALPSTTAKRTAATGNPGGPGARRGQSVKTGQPLAGQFDARKSIAKAGAAFQPSDDFMPVNTAFWCRT